MAKELLQTSIILLMSLIDRGEVEDIYTCHSQNYHLAQECMCPFSAIKLGGGGPSKTMETPDTARSTLAAKCVTVTSLTEAGWKSLQVARHGRQLRPVT